MNGNSPLEMQTRLQALLCGELPDSARLQLLEEIAQNAPMQSTLKQMIAQQKASRAAFGYDKVDEMIEARLPAAMASAMQAAERQQSRDVQKWRSARRIVWRVAASIAVICSLGVALTAYHSGKNIRAQLADIRQQRSLPAVSLTANDLARFRMLWQQVAQGSEPWLLVSNGEGEFGNAQRSANAASVRDEVLLVSWRILTESGQQVYAAELLLTPGQPLQINLPSTSRIAGRTATVTVQANNGYAAVGLSLHDANQVPVGVAGEIPVDSAVHELGQFLVGRTVLRVYVQTQRVPGFHT
jgi:hypothetical protein